MQPKQWKKVANMLKRKIIDRLEKWYQSGHYKAPLVFGARQVGKTTAIREFAKAHYDHLIEVNFVKHPIAAKAFDELYMASLI